MSGPLTSFERAARLFIAAEKLGCDTPTENMIVDAIQDAEFDTLHNPRIIAERHDQDLTSVGKAWIALGAIGVSSPDSSAASVAPQEEWTLRRFKNPQGFESKDYSEIYCGKTLIASDQIEDEAREIADAHNSRLREDKKEIERLKRKCELKDETVCTYENRWLESEKAYGKVSARLTVAREALEKIVNTTDYDEMGKLRGFSLKQIAASALSTLNKPK